MMDVKNKSFINIEGIGENAEIFQWGFIFLKCNSIEIKNLILNGYTENGIGIHDNSGEESSYCKLDS